MSQEIEQEPKKSLSPKAGMTTGSRKRTNGFADRKG